MSLVFSNRERLDASPPRDESMFRFFDRVPGPVWDPAPRGSLRPCGRRPPRPRRPLCDPARVYSHVLREHTASIGDIFARAVQGSR